MMPAISLVFLTLVAQSGYEKGAAEFSRGEYAAARKHLEQDAGDPKARALLAVVQAATGACEAALAELEKPKADRTLNKLTSLARAQCLVQAKRFDDAQTVLAALEKDYPDDADVIYLSADLHRRAWNDAMRRMYAKAPASYRVNEISAEVFETQGKYTEAIAEYRKAIAKKPKAIDLHYRLGRAILLQSHGADALQQARKEFEAELALNPSDAAAEYQLGQILIAQGNKTEAAVHLERALELRRDFPEALIAVGKIRNEAKRFDESVPLFEQAVKLQPRNEVAHYNLMLAYRNAGRTADAQREKAVIEKLQKPPEGEFTDFLKRLGEKPPQ
jgi:tetratricopeptide (TPR) repeat protein